MSEKEVAIVTGGAKGIGRAIACELLKNDYKVVIADINEDNGKLIEDELEKKHGSSNVMFVKCDVSVESDYNRLFEETLGNFGRADVLINNAGVFGSGDVERTFRINVFGVINGCKAAMEYMGKRNGGKGGSVINVASIVGLIPMASEPIYSASKHAVVGLTRSYGTPYYLDTHNLTFNALCPSYVNTDLLTHGVEKLELKLDLSTRSDIMEPDFVARGVIRLLQEKPNGATLAVTKDDGFIYVAKPRELQHVEMK